MEITKKEYKTLKGIVKRYEAKNSTDPLIAGIDFRDTITHLANLKTNTPTSMPVTKYDWANVREDVKWIATHEDGNRVECWSEKPTLNSCGLWTSEGAEYGMKGFIHFNRTTTPYDGDFKDSLEQRPA
jgi:hypothetical protein